MPPTTIQYVNSLKKTIEWAKSWLEHYDPELSKTRIDKIFSDRTFIQKYSSPPSDTKNSGDIAKEAKEDIKEYKEKVEKRLRAIKPPLEDKAIRKILNEISDEDDLVDIQMSYRIHDTHRRTRIRKPTKLAIKLSDMDNNLNKNKKQV
jgi:hypothetical protein